MNNKANLLEGSIPKLLTKLLIPQLSGFIAVLAFNFADSWFISQLDKALPDHTESLYLSSFSMTFPVIFGVGSIAIGMGIAITSLVSRAYGAGDLELAKRITRDALILTILFTLIVTCVGLLTIDSLFTFIGAKPEQLPILREYMTIWYSFSVFMLIPMACNNSMRGAGNTFWPGVVMIAGAVINIIIDPVFIFGFWFVPAMGVKGAAIATVISRVITAFMSVTIAIRWNLIALSKPKFSEMIHEWKELIVYGLPAIIGKISLPVGILGVTMVAASLGKNAVAAMNVSSRVEQFILVAAMALSVVLMIFLSQNLAAGNKTRARKAVNWSYKWIIAYTIICIVVLMFVSEGIAVWFNNITGVQDMTIFYLVVIPFVYPFSAASLIVQQSFFAIRKPMLSGMMDIVKFIVIMVPAAWIGAHYYGYHGMIIALAVAYVSSSLLTIFIFEYRFKKYVVEEKTPV